MLIKMTIRAVLLALATTLSIAAYARADAPKHVDISAGDLSQALLRLSKQYGADLVYRPEQVYGLKTHGAHGEFTTEQAVTRLLQGTPLELRTDSSGAILIALPIVGAGRVDQIPQASDGIRDVSEDSKGGRKSSSGDFRLAQVAQAANPQSPPVNSNPAAAPAAAPPAQSVVQMPEFTVTGARPDPYRVSEATSISRTAGSIMDAPLTVNVVTSEFMSDLGANTGYDVDKFFAGVSGGRGAGIEGIQDRMDLRGFESFTRSFDNFSSGSFQANVDPVFIERQELVMGPDTILQPTGTPGGSINVITKSPLFTESTWVSGEWGNINAGKYTLDTTGPISKDLAYRLILSNQQTPTYIPGSFHEMSIALMLTYKLWGDAQITAKYFHEDWGQRGEAANANDWGEMVYTPSTVNTTISATTPQPGFGVQSWNGSATWSRRSDRPRIGEVEFTSPLFNLVNMRLALNVTEDLFTQDTAYPSVSPSVTYDPTTGYATAIKLPATFNITAMPVVGQYSHSDGRTIQIQNDYAASFKLPWITISPSAGYAFQQQHTFYGYSAQDTNAADLPPVNLLANNGVQLEQHPPLSDYTHGPSNSTSYGITKQAYALSKFAFLDDRVFLTTGVSRLWVDSASFRDTKTIPNGVGNLPVFVGPYTSVYLNSQKDTYLAGAVVKPTSNTSIYYSFSTNAALTAFTPAGNTIGLPLWQTGKQQEVGLKGVFFDGRFQVTADHFAITQANLVSPNPLFNLDTTQPPQLLTNIYSKGYELNVVGGITPDLSIIASATQQKYRDPENRRSRNVPDQLANLLLNYHWHSGLLNGANVFVGVNHEGNVAGETITGYTSLGVAEKPSFYVPGWTVVSVGTGYTWDRYTLHLNVDNLLDRHFFWDPASRISVPMYDGRTIRGTLILKF